jgi:hypothetical protein
LAFSSQPILVTPKLSVFYGETRFPLPSKKGRRLTQQSMKPTARDGEIKLWERGRLNTGSSITSRI